VPGRPALDQGAVAFGVVVAADLAVVLLRPPFRLGGVFDECAHLATAVVARPSFGPRDADWTAGYYAGSVGIDADHVPVLIDPDRVDATAQRPPAHTVLTPLSLALLSRRATGPGRQRLAGAAAGAAVHLARDIATGPGVGLLSPLVKRRLRLPYALYLVTLFALLRRRKGATLSAAYSRSRPSAAPRHISGASGRGP
jgi:hypothetical protein